MKAHIIIVFFSGKRSKKTERIDDDTPPSKDHSYNKSPFATQVKSASSPKVAVTDNKKNTACDNKNPVADGQKNMVDGDKTAGDQDPVAKSSQNNASFENIACDPDPVHAVSDYKKRSYKTWR